MTASTSAMDYFTQLKVIVIPGIYVSLTVMDVRY